MARQRPIEATVPHGSAAAFRDWKVILLFAGMLTLFFAKILSQSAWLWEDMMYFSYPVRVFAATSMAMGHLPLWNPFTFNGMPFLADIQTTVLYIPCVALTLFVRNGGLDFYWLEVMVIAHYLLAGWGMYVLASSFHVRRIPAVFAGTAYMLSGFMITHAIHQQVITLVAWYPLIVFLFRSAMEGRSWVPVFLCALALGHSTFAGYPQLSLYLHFFLGAYFVFLLLTTHRGRALVSRPALVLCLKAGLVVALGLGIAAVQLLPTSELADLSQRAQITYEKSTEGSLSWSQLMTLFIPKLFGAAGAGGNSYWGPGIYWYFWETCIYVGILPVVLALLSAVVVRKNPHATFFWGTALFALLFSLGDNFFLHRFFFDFVPGFSRFRNPARMGVFLTFAISILSAFTLHALLYGERKAADLRRHRTALLVVAGVVLVLCLSVSTGGLDGSLGVPRDREAPSAMHRNATVAALFLFCAAIPLYGIITRRSWSRGAALVLPGILFLDMVIFGAEQNTSTLNPADYFHRADRVVQFLRNELRNELFRTNTRNQYGMIMDRNQGMVDRIPTMEGYTPLVLQRAIPPLGDTPKLDLLNVKYRTVADASTRTLSLALHPTYLPRAFFLYAYRVVHTEAELLTALADTAWNHRTTALLENDPSRVFRAPDAATPSKAQVTAYEENRIELDVFTPTDGLLILSEIYYPGWEAKIDGAHTEVLCADYDLRAIVVPAGTHHVVFAFVHPPFIRGAYITGGALLLCLAGIAAPFLRRKLSQEKGS